MAYFPHAGYGDAAVQQSHAMLDECHNDAKRKQQYLILGCDFNADAATTALLPKHLGNWVRLRDEI